MVAWLVLAWQARAATIPVANEFDSKARQMFGAARAPKQDEFEHRWFCVQTSKSGYVADPEPAVIIKEDHLQASDAKTHLEKTDRALVLTQKDRTEVLRVLESTKGLRLIIERSENGRKGPGYSLCLPRTELFGEASDTDFLKYAKATFEVGRLPLNGDFKGDWTCAYETKKDPIALFKPPQILVKDGTIFMPEFNGKKRVKMEINDKAWVASLEDGDVRAAYRLQRAAEGVRLLQEAEGSM